MARQTKPAISRREFMAAFRKATRNHVLWTYKPAKGDLIADIAIAERKRIERKIKDLYSSGRSSEKLSAPRLVSNLARAAFENETNKTLRKSFANPSFLTIRRLFLFNDVFQELPAVAAYLKEEDRRENKRRIEKPCAAHQSPAEPFLNVKTW